MGFIVSGKLTEIGGEVAGLTGLDPASRYVASAPILAEGVETAFVGQGGESIHSHCFGKPRNGTRSWRTYGCANAPGCSPLRPGRQWTCVYRQHAATKIAAVPAPRSPPPCPRASRQPRCVACGRFAGCEGCRCGSPRLLPGARSAHRRRRGTRGAARSALPCSMSGRGPRPPTPAVARRPACRPARKAGLGLPSRRSATRPV